MAFYLASFVKFYECALVSAPYTPVFISTTAAEITIHFDKVQNDHNQLRYDVKAVEQQQQQQQHAETMGTCDVSTTTCTVEGLRPGKTYSLYVRACINKENSPYQEICGEYSTQPLKRDTLLTSKIF